MLSTTFPEGELSLGGILEVGARNVRREPQPDARCAALHPEEAADRVQIVVGKSDGARLERVEQFQLVDLVGTHPQPFQLLLEREGMFESDGQGREEPLETPEASAGVVPRPDRSLVAVAVGAVAAELDEQVLELPGWGTGACFRCGSGDRTHLLLQRTGYERLAGAVAT